jgi:hypothetical protein
LREVNRCPFDGVHARNVEMNFVQLILTVCAISQPTACDERRLTLETETGSARNCVMQAMPYIAQWAGEHPNVTVTRWRCVPPGGADDKT